MPAWERKTSGRTCCSLGDFIPAYSFLRMPLQTDSRGSLGNDRHRRACDLRVPASDSCFAQKPSVFAHICCENHASKQDRERGSSLCFQLACFCRYVLAVFLFVFVIASVIVISSHYLLRKDLLKVFQTQGLKPCLWIGHFLLASVSKLTAILPYGESL